MFLDILEISREKCQPSKLNRQYGYARFLLRDMANALNRQEMKESSGIRSSKKMIKATRLKHLLLNTEKIYTGWNRLFQEFVNVRDPAEATGDVLSG